MTKESNLILSKNEIFQKLKRIAYEIYENNYLEKKLVVAGIPETGYKIAQLLIKELKEISPLELHLIKVNIDKENPANSEISLDGDIKLLKKASLILVDDVLNTGRTFLYSLKPILETEVKKVQTAVLVYRGHSLFPISADFTGYELSTTLNEHIEVMLDEGKEGVYLY